MNVIFVNLFAVTNIEMATKKVCTDVSQRSSHINNVGQKYLSESSENRHRITDHERAACAAPRAAALAACRQQRGRGGKKKEDIDPSVTILFKYTIYCFYLLR